MTYLHSHIQFSHLTSYDWSLVVVFVIGYLFIIFEHLTHINKSTVALIMAVVGWGLIFSDSDLTKDQKDQYLLTYVNNAAQIFLFLFGALAIVEIINSHNGFAAISKLIHVHSRKQLLWVISIFTFFLSAIIDNLTTTIVMIAILQKLVKDRESRWIIGGAIVIAANAGGAWSPIGDVTTTMLWIGGNITTLATIRDLFFPSLVCVLISLLWLNFMVKEDVEHRDEVNAHMDIEPYGTLLLCVGLAALISVPIMKVVFGLPPFLGIFLGLGILWLITDILYGPDHMSHLKAPAAFAKIDITSALFFLGILLSVSTLEIVGVLSALANQLNAWFGNIYGIATSIGIVSAIIDNVPLVAASMGMFTLETYPPDSNFWQLIAYCAGTGGSMLIIGSAAGVAYMGLEKVTFDWFLRKITIPAALGYFGGIACYKLLH